MYGAYWKALCAALIIIESASFSLAARNKADSEILAGFDEPIQIFGEMIRNNIDFVDGLNVDVYSPTNRTLTVSKNMTPMTGRYTSGTTGGTYRGLSAYSYVLQTNDVANDVIARVQLPWDPEQLSLVSVEPSNTFVGKLAADNQSWAIAEQKLDVNKAIFKSRINQMTSLAGEYRLIGRVGQEVGNTVQGFGTSPESTINVLAGGRQDFAFIDGLRFSVFSETNLTMNVDVFSPIPAELIPQGMKSLYAFGYVVNTTQATELPLPTAPLPSNSTASGAAGLVPSGLGTSRSSLAGSPIPTSSAVSGSGLNGGLGTPFGGAPPPFPAPPAGSDRGGKGEGGKGEGDKGSRGKGEGNGNGPRRAKMLRRQEPSSSLPAPPPGSTAALPPPVPPASASGSQGGSAPGTPTPTNIPVPPAGPSGTTAALPPPPPPGSASISGSQPSGTTVPPALPPPPPAGPSPPAITVSAGPGPAQTPGPRSVRAADIQFPINMAVLNKLLGTNQPANLGANNGNNNQQGLLGESATDTADAMLRNIKFQVARRDVGATTQPFTAFNIGAGNNAPAQGTAGSQPNAGGENNGNGAANAGNMRLSIDGGTLRFSGAQQLDGEYIVLVPGELIAQGQGQIQKGSKNAGSVLGVDFTNIGAAFAVLIFAALLV